MYYVVNCLIIIVNVSIIKCVVKDISRLDFIKEIEFWGEYNGDEVIVIEKGRMCNLLV